jgi:hypothetical protein
MVRSGPKLVQTLIGTMDRIYGGRRSRVRIDVRVALHIQHRRPNGWADRGPHSYKHSLEQWSEVMGVGGRGCALMCAARANVRVALHIQHRRPNGWADRGRNRYKHSLEQCAEVMGVGDRVCALMRAQTRARSTTHRALAPEGPDRLNPNLVQKHIGAMGNGHK